MIPYFRNWLIIESKDDLDVDVKSNDNKKDISEFDIQIPGDDNSIRHFRMRDDNLYEIDTENRETPVDDPTTIKYVRQAFKSINKVKEQSTAETIERVTANIDDELDKMLDSYIEKGKFNFYDSDKYQSFLEKIKDIKEFEGKYIGLNEFEIKDKDVISKWFNPKQYKSIGKGEFLLPILFSDVKKTPITIDAKGDDEIKDSDKKIEVKTGGSSFDFYGPTSARLKKDPLVKRGENKTRIEENFKNECARRIARYLLTRNIGHLYLVLFNNEIRKEDITGIYVLNCGETIHFKSLSNDDERLNHLADFLYQKIDIVDKFQYKNEIADSDFIISYEGESDGKIKVFLNSDFFKTVESPEVKKHYKLLDKIQKELEQDSDFKECNTLTKKIEYILYIKYKDNNLSTSDVQYILNEQGNNSVYGIVYNINVQGFENRQIKEAHKKRVEEIKKELEASKELDSYNKLIDKVEFIKYERYPDDNLTTRDLSILLCNDINHDALMFTYCKKLETEAKVLNRKSRKVAIEIKKQIINDDEFTKLSSTSKQITYILNHYDKDNILTNNDFEYILDKPISYNYTTKFHLRPGVNKKMVENTILSFSEFCSLYD